MNKQIVIISIVNLLICWITCSNANDHNHNHVTSDSLPDNEQIAFDPTFGGHEMVPMSAEMPFLDSRKPLI